MNKLSDKLTNYEVFEYWRKQKLPNGDMIVIDMGEPDCWGCKCMIKTESEELLKNADFEKIWNKTKGMLNQVPITLGGKESGNPKDVFLLCEKCAEKAPLTDDKEMFFDWVMDMRSKTNAITVMFGMDIYEIERINDEIELISGVFNVPIEKVNSVFSSYAKTTELGEKSGVPATQWANSATRVYSLIKELKKELVLEDLIIECKGQSEVVQEKYENVVNDIEMLKGYLLVK